jgi:hypothetical protein
MSLAISLGVLATDNIDPEWAESLRAAFRRVNRLLAAHGLPPHVEPERLLALPYRGQLRGFPYSCLHYLRRAVAYARQAPEEFCPLSEGENAAEDARIDTELFVVINSHLICHSDCEGFYVPIDFDEPLYEDEETKIPGGILGSSQRALAETRLAAPLLGIPLKGMDLADEVANRIAEERDGAHPYWIERKVWLTMFESFRLSVENGCAVVFN